MHGLHECVVVQKRLAHPHKHQIDPRRRLHTLAAADPDLLPIQHRSHLPSNLARRQVPPYPQLRRQAKLAVHRASHLARHTNRRPLIPIHLGVVILTRRVKISVIVFLPDRRKTGCPIHRSFTAMGGVATCAFHSAPNLPLLFLRRLAPIPALAAIPIRHPNRLHSLAIRHPHQVALSPIH